MSNVDNERPSDSPEQQVDPKSSSSRKTFIPTESRLPILENVADVPIRDFNDLIDPKPTMLDKNDIDKAMKEDMEHNKEDADKGVRDNTGKEATDKGKEDKEFSDKGKDATDKGKDSKEFKDGKDSSETGTEREGVQPPDKPGA